METNKSVAGSATKSAIVFKSERKARTLLFHALAFGGVGLLGQYPDGNSGETWLGLRLNSRMSHCATRMCSSNSQGECAAPLARFPRRRAGRPLMAASKLT